MIDVEVRQLIFVNAHRMVFLSLHQTFLYLSPGHGVKLRVVNVKSLVVKMFNVPKLEQLIGAGQELDDPEAGPNKQKEPCLLEKKII